MDVVTRASSELPSVGTVKRLNRLDMSSLLSARSMLVPQVM